MNIHLHGVSIRTIAVTLGDEEFDLTDLCTIYDPNEVNRIIKSNGISKLRLASEDVCASDLCEMSAKQILKDYDVNLISGIIFVSQTPDFILPATSASLQHRLGLPKDSVVFDINHGCSGYVYGLYLASLLITSGSCESVLVCAGDVLSRHINPLDKSNRTVFGDAGSVTLIEKGDGDIAFSIMTDGSGAEHLIIPAGGARYPKDENSEMVSVRNDGNMRSDEDFFMNGIEVMNFSVREVPKIIDTVLATKGWNKSDVTLYGFHQANAFILDYLRKIIKIPKESIPIAMGEIGNTSVASIPTMLALEGKRLSQENRLEKTVLCGFGVGLSCSAAALDLSNTTILPIQ